MFEDFFKRKWCKWRINEIGIILIAVGIGILLALMLPPLGWMIGCAVGLIIAGVCFRKDC